jgi:hypothetical protein
MGRIFTAIVVAATLAALVLAANEGASAASAGLAVHQTSSIADLFPGGPPGVLRGDFDNPSDDTVFVHEVTATIEPFRVQTDPAKPACTDADFVIAGAAPVDAGIPPGVAVGSWSGLTVAMTKPPTDQANCEGVSITIDYVSR